MADIKAPSPVDSSIINKYADQGDGTHALVVSASVAAPVGGATEATLATLLTEVAPATDTASSGLNGRLQRVAQRLTSLIALLPAALVSGRLDVNIGAAPATLTSQGTVAHDAADSGNPVKVGAKALAYGTNPTGVTANDRTDLYANRAGILHVLGGHPNIITHRVNYTAAQTDTAIITVSAGTKIAVTSVMVTADNANSVDVAVIIGFATATTPTGAGVLIGHPGIAPGSGVSRGNGAGVIGVGADDEDIRITSEVPTTGSITCVISYFTVEG